MKSFMPPKKPNYSQHENRCSCYPVARSVRHPCHPVQLIAEKVADSNHQRAPDTCTQQIPSEETPEGHSGCACHRTCHETCPSNEPRQEDGPITVRPKECSQAVVVSADVLILLRELLQQLLPARPSKQEADGVSCHGARDSHRVERSQIHAVSPCQKSGRKQNRLLGHRYSQVADENETENT